MWLLELLSGISELKINFCLQSQYKFVFDTLSEYTRGIDSRFPVSELANKIKERGIKDQKTKKNVYQMEYQVRNRFKSKEKKVRRHFQQRQSRDDFTKKSHWIIFSCEIAQFDFSDDVF